MICAVKYKENTKYNSNDIYDYLLWLYSETSSYICEVLVTSTAVFFSVYRAGQEK